MQRNHSQFSDIDTRSGLQAYLGNSGFEDRERYDTFGWIEDPDENDYYATYLRNPIAKAVVDKPAETTWREYPEIQDTDDEDTTEFEGDVEELQQRHDVWSYANRIDKLAGIGEYGILVLGFADGEDLDQPVNQDQLSGPEDIAWLRVFPQISITDVDFETDQSSPRWGQPLNYDVDLSDADDAEEGMFGSVSIHHERVVHVPATELLDDEVRGTPRLEPVFNPVNDIEKVVGSVGELAYRGADYGLHIDVDPEYDFDGDELNEELQRYTHQVQNFIRTQGANVETLGGEIADPSGIVDTLMGLISAQTGIPKRMFMGSEQGELASSQDVANYFGRINERQTQFAEQHIVRNLIDRLREFGMLTEPENGIYDVHWPNLFELNELEEADVKNTRAQTLKNMAPQGNTDLVATAEARTEFIEEGDASVLAPDDGDDGMPEMPAPGEETPEQQDAFSAAFDLNALGEGDVVELPSGGKGVIVMEGGDDVEIDGEAVEAGEVVVAYASRRGYTIVDADDLTGGDFEEDTDADPEELKDAEVDTNVYANDGSVSFGLVGKLLGNDIGFDSWPDSWEEADVPARIIALDAWSSMGGTWTGCFEEIGSKRICSAFKDELLGTTAWR